jgi:hypothetical protein
LRKSVHRSGLLPVQPGAMFELTEKQRVDPAASLASTRRALVDEARLLRR